MRSTCSAERRKRKSNTGRKRRSNTAVVLVGAMFRMELILCDADSGLSNMKE
jgi:hypothetical protein